MIAGASVAHRVTYASVAHRVTYQAIYRLELGGPAP
jgi:hypothetical protein